MSAEPVPDRPRIDPRAIDDLAAKLLTLAGGESVRVIEALAAVFAKQLCGRSGSPGLSDAASSYQLEPAPERAIGAMAPPVAACQLVICQRIARRALRGSLVDPTGGATAFHRIDANPSWARDRLPMASAGPFLFYASE